MKPLLLLISLLILYPSAGFAEDSANGGDSALPDGEEVAAHINSRDEGQAVSRKLSIEMRDRRGKTRQRETMSYRKYYAEEKRTVIFYLAPKNIKDTAFLTYDYIAPEREDNQWLYLPALRKVKRISASDRGDYFLGTDMTYEDIKLETRVSTADFSFQTLGSCDADGKPGLQIDGTPRTADIARELGYSKTLSCVDSEIWMVRKSQFWDIKGKLLKTITISNIEQIQGIWTQQKIDVENHKTGHSTSLVFSAVDYQSAVPDDLFTTNAIKRGL
ncbi:MAG: outer membrane lipoprotein-sorting protein [Gammaproteobacteria bacterium]|nr:outer membrane lipoprotein-sorting protein [Gammaproteobacteria bacterium]MBQ0839849.1 outer membrane lipoprotein-sorting protein [Gammaproteobacteria bacterium]